MMGSMPPTFRQLRWITAFTGIQSIDDVFIPAALTGGNVAVVLVQPLRLVGVHNQRGHQGR